MEGRSPTTDTTISLAWNASTDNSGNFSYRVTESSVNTFTVAVPQTRTTITLTRLWPGQTYRYTVYAVDAAGNRSGISNTVIYTVPADVTDPAGFPHSARRTTGTSELVGRRGRQIQVIASDVFGNAVEGNTVTMTMPSTTDTVPPTAPTGVRDAAAL